MALTAWLVRPVLRVRMALRVLMVSTVSTEQPDLKV
jgi:hypothetical protein